MPSCFAPGCKSGYRNDTDHHFFESPRDSDEFKKWEQMLRRKDRRLTHNSKRFFGVVRSFHGDDDHPTIVQFSQIYRLLSLFTPVKNAVRGNCSGQADTVLVSLQKSLGEKAKAAAEIKRAVEAKLHKKLFGITASEGNGDELDEHDCEKPGCCASDSYMCGATQAAPRV
uniref:Protein containing THAP domain n=1 Tax=Rhipicephalus zambeziensis TaxID=60191 RepID=A0A224YZD4_9ACAR